MSLRLSQSSDPSTVNPSALSLNFIISPTKLKLKSSVVIKIFNASVHKAKTSLNHSKYNEKEQLNRLLLVEREFIKQMISVKNKNIGKNIMEVHQNSLNATNKRVLKKKNKSVCIINHTRKNKLAKGLETIIRPLKPKVHSKLFSHLSRKKWPEQY